MKKGDHLCHRLIHLVVIILGQFIFLILFVRPTIPIFHKDFGPSFNCLYGGTYLTIVIGWNCPSIGMWHLCFLLLFGWMRRMIRRVNHIRGTMIPITIGHVFGIGRQYTRSWNRRNRTFSRRTGLGRVEIIFRSGRGGDPKKGFKVIDQFHVTYLIGGWRRVQMTTTTTTTTNGRFIVKT